MTGEGRGSNPHMQEIREHQCQRVVVSSEECPSLLLAFHFRLQLLDGALQVRDCVILHSDLLFQLRLCFAHITASDGRSEMSAPLRYNENILASMLHMTWSGVTFPSGATW